MKYMRNVMNTRKINTSLIYVKLAKTSRVCFF